MTSRWTRHSTCCDMVAYQSALDLDIELGRPVLRGQWPTAAVVPIINIMSTQSSIIATVP